MAATLTSCGSSFRMSSHPSRKRSMSGETQWIRGISTVRYFRDKLFSLRVIQKPDCCPDSLQYGDNHIKSFLCVLLFRSSWRPALALIMGNLPRSWKSLLTTEWLSWMRAPLAIPLTIHGISQRLSPPLDLTMLPLTYKEWLTYLNVYSATKILSGSIIQHWLCSQKPCYSKSGTPFNPQEGSISFIRNKMFSSHVSKQCIGHLGVAWMKSANLNGGKKMMIKGTATPFVWDVLESQMWLVVFVFLHWKIKVKN